jgi:hypothetical protein
MWLLLLLSTLSPSAALAADFDLSLGYGQSRDFWQTVQDVQDRTGNLAEIQSVVKDKYGKPDFGYSYLDAAYSYPHEAFDSSLLGMTVIGTRAEALAGGEISNPISPEIQAYAASVGIFSFGLRSIPGSDRSTYLDARLFGGVGPEKRLYAQGAEFIDAIPVRSGTLLLGGTEVSILNNSQVGEDFWITTDIFLRGTYFHSSTPTPKSKPKEDREFITLRWRLQNEWLKQTDTFLSSNTRFGILSVLGQNPLPFFNLPTTWDYQQKLDIYPGLASISGIGGIVRFLSESSVPNVALYGGYYGGAFGGGVELQLGSVLLSGSTYGVESLLTPAREKTRIWNAALGVAL